MRARVKSKPRDTKRASAEHPHNDALEEVYTLEQPACAVAKGALHLDLIEPERHGVAHTPIPILMDERSVYRSAIVADFASGYFPSSIGSSTLAAILDQWTTVRSPAMAAGNDALGLLYAGNAHNDARLILAGRQRHAAATYLVRRELGKPWQNTSGIIAAAQDLLSCEIYEMVSSGVQGCRMHLAGLAILLCKTRVDCARSFFHAFLTVQYSHVSLMFALVERKAIPLFEMNMQMDHDSPESVAALMKSAKPLAAMLEECDRLDGELDASRTHAKILQKRMETLEMELIAWLVRYDQHIVARGSWYSSGLPSANSRRSSKLTSEPQQLKFRTFRDAVIHCFHASLLLLVRQCRCGLLDGALETMPQSYILTTEANASAMRVRQCLDFVSITAGNPLSEALVVRAPLQFLESWYRWQRDALAVAWCRQKQSQLKARLPFIHWDALLPWSFIAIHWDDDSERLQRD